MMAGYLLIMFIHICLKGESSVQMFQKSDNTCVSHNRDGGVLPVIQSTIFIGAFFDSPNTLRHIFFWKLSSSFNCFCVMQSAGSPDSNVGMTMVFIVVFMHLKLIWFLSLIAVPSVDQKFFSARVQRFFTFKLSTSLMLFDTLSPKCGKGFHIFSWCPPNVTVSASISGFFDPKMLSSVLAHPNDNLYTF